MENSFTSTYNELLGYKHFIDPLFDRNRETVMTLEGFDPPVVEYFVEKIESSSHTKMISDTSSNPLVNLDGCYTYFPSYKSLPIWITPNVLGSIWIMKFENGFSPRKDPG